MSRPTPRRRKKNASEYKQSIAKQLKAESDKYFSEHHKHGVTRTSYQDHYKMFIDYCRKNYHSVSKEECGEHIQDYSDWLQSQGKSASTIHTYLAPVCGYHGVPMKDIHKPQRKVSENVRSRARDDKYKRTDQQYDNPEFALVAEFQKRVGIRRAELKSLRLDALKQDESGQWCIEVKKGKGGKYQLQRILPEDVEFIRGYFTTPDSTEKLFKTDDFSKNMDYHHLRALQAQRAYQYYYAMAHTGDPKKDAAAAYKLRGELMAMWNAHNIDKRSGKPRKFPFEETKGIYKLRGDNRRYALEHGLPVEYDKLCVMAVSIFHLSHWRLDTLTNYLIAV